MYAMWMREAISCSFQAISSASLTTPYINQNNTIHRQKWFSWFDLRWTHVADAQIYSRVFDVCANKISCKLFIVCLKQSNKSEIVWKKGKEKININRSEDDFIRIACVCVMFFFNCYIFVHFIFSIVSELWIIYISTCDALEIYIS